jgi:hypothetical protein
MDENEKGSVEFRCSFCGKPRREVRKIISGARAFICDECVTLCSDIIAEEDAAGRQAAGSLTAAPSARQDAGMETLNEAEAEPKIEPTPAEYALGETILDILKVAAVLLGQPGHAPMFKIQLREYGWVASVETKGHNGTGTSAGYSSDGPNMIGYDGPAQAVCALRQRLADARKAEAALARRRLDELRDPSAGPLLRPQGC